MPFYQGSIAERVLIDSIIDECGIGAIMHFAGSIVVPESVEHPLKYYANNTLASHSLISAAVDAGVKHILFSSTAAVYGAPERVPIVEDDPKLPINPYGASKLMTERMLEDASAAHPFNYGALRYFNVAGADPKGRTGQIGKGSTHLIKIACEAAVGKRAAGRGLRQRLSDARRHLHPRLYPRQRPRRGACRRARLAGRASGRESRR